MSGRRGLARLAPLAWLFAALAGGTAAAQAPLPGTQPCAEAALGIAGGFLGIASFRPGAPIVAHVCKRHPVESQLTLMAVAWDERQPEHKQLLFALLDESRREVVASRRETVEEDAALRLDERSLRLDTPPYDLAPGVRAVGLDLTSAYIPHCGDGGSGALRTLYVREGRQLRPVLAGLVKTNWTFVRPGRSRCNNAAGAPETAIVENIALTLAMSPRSSNGFQDIDVTAKSSRDDGLPSSRAPLRHVLRYDGREYRLDTLEKALSAWREPALRP